jgi:hypothetical protein
MCACHALCTSGELRGCMCTCTSLALGCIGQWALGTCSGASPAAHCLPPITGSVCVPCLHVQLQAHWAGPGSATRHAHAAPSIRHCGRHPSAAGRCAGKCSRMCGARHYPAVALSHMLQSAVYIPKHPVLHCLPRHASCLCLQRQAAGLGTGGMLTADDLQWHQTQRQQLERLYKTHGEERRCSLF